MSLTHQVKESLWFNHSWHRLWPLLMSLLLPCVRTWFWWRVRVFSAPFGTSQTHICISNPPKVSGMTAKSRPVSSPSLQPIKEPPVTPIAPWPGWIELFLCLVQWLSPQKPQTVACCWDLKHAPSALGPEDRCVQSSRKQQAHHPLPLSIILSQVTQDSKRGIEKQFANSINPGTLGS